METKTKTKTRSSLAETLFACFAIRKMQLNCFVSEVADAKSKAQRKWTQRKQHTQEVHYISQLPIAFPFRLFTWISYDYKRLQCIQVLSYHRHTNLYVIDTSTIVPSYSIIYFETLTHSLTHNHHVKCVRSLFWMWNNLKWKCRAILAISFSHSIPLLREKVTSF